MGVGAAIIGGDEDEEDGGEELALHEASVSVLLGHEEDGGTVKLELYTYISASDKTPSMPWHRMEDPKTQILGLMIFTLLRTKFFLPLLVILSM